ncbi:Protein MEI2-like 2 [Lasiodiplodia hormozganensis]|uniref:Protein MEI2-like 2 n=1 Tax=Lasiodiplodia hormozganensis TaxID=869390 RepID=A0AA39XRE9_9PEZI|nr:Protein MEI2-like 2 [Lasiodiplodia hormozganensis]
MILIFDKYDLQALLSTWVRGKFDFLYLRIDFANMCNVGYAFVNFDMPMTIVEVKQKLDAHGWPRPGHLGSTKRAAMSYATVQGPG